MSQTYDQWYARCDRTCIRISGVGIDDLPDGNSYDAWHDGVSHEEYVLDRLDEAGFPHEPAPPALPSRGDGRVRVTVPLSPHQHVTAPSRYQAAELLVHKHGVTPAEAVQAAADV